MKRLFIGVVALAIVISAAGCSQYENREPEPYIAYDNTDSETDFESLQKVAKEFNSTPEDIRDAVTSIIERGWQDAPDKLMEADRSEYEQSDFIEFGSKEISPFFHEGFLEEFEFVMNSTDPEFNGALEMLSEPVESAIPLDFFSGFHVSSEITGGTGDTVYTAGDNADFKVTLGSMNFSSHDFNPEGGGKREVRVSLLVDVTITPKDDAEDDIEFARIVNYDFLVSGKDIGLVWVSHSDLV